MEKKYIIEYVDILDEIISLIEVTLNNTKNNKIESRHLKMICVDIDEIIEMNILV